VRAQPPSGAASASLRTASPLPGRCADGGGPDPYSDPAVRALAPPAETLRRVVARAARVAADTASARRGSVGRRPPDGWWSMGCGRCGGGALMAAAGVRPRLVLSAAPAVVAC